MTQTEGKDNGHKEMQETTQPTGINNPSDNSVTQIARQLMRSEGIYIKGKIQGMKVMFTVDTGAIRTVLSDRAYRNIPEDVRPHLEKSYMLTSVNGQPLKEMGKAKFQFELGKLKLDEEIVVAEIEDEALLGLDVLMKGPGGPADIRLSEGVILLNGCSVPCIQNHQPSRLRKVRAAEDYQIPARSEMIIDVFVDREEDDCCDESKDFIVEPVEKFTERYPLLMATALVEINNSVTSKVRLMNPSEEEVIIHQDTEIGEAEKLEEDPTLLLTTENESEVGISTAVRRIQLKDPTQPIMWDTNEGIIRSVAMGGTSSGGKSGVVSPYLMELYNDVGTQTDITGEVTLQGIMRAVEQLQTLVVVELGGLKRAVGRLQGAARPQPGAGTRRGWRH